MSRPTYYVTTPIYYATGEPHIGHSYTTVVADAAARYRRLTGHDVFFLTGTDEHGQKMEREAAKRGTTPRELADHTSLRYSALWDKLAIRPDGFVRTTQERHRKAVHRIWSLMTERGDIYKGDYEGTYCVGCELFYQAKELVDGKCPDHGTVPELVKESGYFFRLSKYEQPLLDLFAQHPEFVQPPSRLNEVMSFVKSGLRDLSISRQTTSWGIPVADDPEHVIYVWVDALTNYLSGIGWPDSRDWEKWWPADAQIVGKDILRFHAVFWPAFLMAAGLPLPRQIYAHGWWLRDGQKISKSSGGAIKVEPLIEKFGADAVRYFLLREIPFGLDGTYSDQAFVQRYNADLANDFGNLTQRTLQLIKRSGDGAVPVATAPDDVRERADAAVAAYREHFDTFAFSRGIEAAWELVRTGNRFIDEKAPWALAKDPTKRAELDQVLYTAAELVRLVATCLWPVVPEGAAIARTSLGLAPDPNSVDELAWGGLKGGERITDFKPIFPRVDERKWLEVEPKMSDDNETAAAVAPDESITIDEFFKTKLRVGRVVEAEKVKKSKKLLRLQIDLGDEKRQVVAGIAERYEPEQLIGRNVVIVANLKPAKLMGIESQGMLLAASADGLPLLAGFDEDVAPGTEVR